jgi:hypothetical protein
MEEWNSFILGLNKEFPESGSIWGEAIKDF